MENITCKIENLEYKCNIMEHRFKIYNIKIKFLQHCDVLPAIEHLINFFITKVPDN